MEQKLAKDVVITKLMIQRQWFIDQTKSHPHDDGDPTIRYLGYIFPENREWLKQNGFKLKELKPLNDSSQFWGLQRWIIRPFKEITLSDEELELSEFRMNMAKIIYDQERRFNDHHQEKATNSSPSDTVSPLMDLMGIFLKDILAESDESDAPDDPDDFGESDESDDPDDLGEFGDSDDPDDLDESDESDESDGLGEFDESDDPDDPDEFGEFDESKSTNS